MIVGPPSRDLFPMEWDEEFSYKISRPGVSGEVMYEVPQDDHQLLVPFEQSEYKKPVTGRSGISSPGNVGSSGADVTALTGEALLALQGVIGNTIAYQQIETQMMNFHSDISVSLPYDNTALLHVPTIARCWNPESDSGFRIPLTIMSEGTSYALDVSKIGLCARSVAVKNQKGVVIQALFDTGASLACIHPSVARAINAGLFEINSPTSLNSYNGNFQMAF